MLAPVRPGSVPRLPPVDRVAAVLTERTRAAWDDAADALDRLHELQRRLRQLAGPELDEARALDRHDADEAARAGRDSPGKVREREVSQRVDDLGLDLDAAAGIVHERLVALRRAVTDDQHDIAEAAVAALRHTLDEHPDDWRAILAATEACAWSREVDDRIDLVPLSERRQLEAADDLLRDLPAVVAERTIRNLDWLLDPDYNPAEARPIVVNVPATITE